MTLRVKLAGHTVDREALQVSGTSSPETLPAAYARISRSPKSIETLRREALADISTARKLNKRVVFDYGHASVAEHCVFNFDIEGVSRLAIETIEHSRLCSYTEKSQRYVKLGADYIIPAEVLELGLGDKFKALLELQNTSYTRLYDGLRAVGRTAKQAAEDARYVTSLATTSQLGMTINARNLEGMIRRLLRSDLAEVREIGSRLLSCGQHLAPSLVRHIEIGRAAPIESADHMEILQVPKYPTSLPYSESLNLDIISQYNGVVHLVDYTTDGDSVICAALLHHHEINVDVPFYRCRTYTRCMPAHHRREIIWGALQRLSKHDPVPREFELAGATFDIVLSAACYGQLKRHRMATLIPQAYNVMFGDWTVPPAIAQAKDTDLVKIFDRVMLESAALWDEIYERNPQAAPYALTQAHHRRVLLAMNCRELYHFGRLRLDMAAQWDIREIAERMVSLLRRRFPLALMGVCGKDKFNEVWESLGG